MSSNGFVSINGQVVPSKDAKISIWDTSFHRGDGVFEVMKLLENGKIRSLERHLVRLHTSATAVGCPLPSPETLIEWLEAAAAASADPNDAPGSLRLIATKGGSVPSSVIISWSPISDWPESFTLHPLLAPWHPAGAPGWETPIKWTSYGPNVVSAQKAKDAGFSDALLLSNDRLESSSRGNIEDCHVLDGPNFAISWISNNCLYVPCSTTLGLLPSITQEIVMDLAQTKLKLQVHRGVYPLKDVLAAEEVFVTSTTRGVIPVTRIGTTELRNHFTTTKEIGELLKQVQQ
jgi:branched-subunit amino acid aminotransferase/4-amino-4-deoxychorismate lyase